MIEFVKYELLETCGKGIQYKLTDNYEQELIVTEDILVKLIRDNSITIKGFKLAASDKLVPIKSVLLNSGEKRSLDKYRAAMLGAAIGDAMGVPYEFHDASDIPNIDKLSWHIPKDFTRSWPEVPVGTWSDDTALMLALAGSLTEKKKFDPRDIMDNFVGWYKHGDWTPDGKVFDIGNQTRAALDYYIKKKDVNNCGGVVPNGKGNGSLMRTLPIALYYSNDPYNVIIHARLQSKLTHDNVETNLCCSLYSVVVKYLLDGYEAKEAIDKGIETMVEFYSDGLAEYHNLYRAEYIQKEFQRPFIGNGTGYVVDSLKSALMIIERANSFRDAIIQAIKLGNDTDTTACIVGGMAGALFGTVNHFDEGLRRHELVSKIAFDLYVQSANPGSYSIIDYMKKGIFR